MALGITPATFVITGSGFTPNGGVTVNVLNSSGAVVAAANYTADSNGALNGSNGISVPSALIESIGQNANGTYNGSVDVIDGATGVLSNSKAVVLNVTVIVPTIAISATTFAFTET
jgi:hypothetical protein